MHERCLSVVIPCYNEEKTVTSILDAVLAQPLTAEVIVVDDGSVDASAAIVADHPDDRVRLERQPRNLGKGAALRRGLGLATQPYVLIQDADLEYDPRDYPRLLQPLLEGRADVVYGSRFLSGEARRVLYFWHSVGNRLLTTASNMTTNLNFTDMETCYKVFRREVLADIVIEEDRFGFEPEITAKVARAGWRVHEVGIAYDGRTYAEGKKIGWKDGVRALWCIGRYGLGPRRDPLTSSPERRAGPDADTSPTHGPPACSTHDSAWIAEMIGPYLGDRVLEVGAGGGTLTEHLRGPGRTVVASDASERAVDELGERFAGAADVEVVGFDVEAGPTGGLEADTVVLVNVLEHVDDVTALGRIRDLLPPGGYLVLYVPAFDRLYGRFDRSVGRRRRYTRAGLSARLRQSGFAVVEARYVDLPGAVSWFVRVRVLGRPPASADARALGRVTPSLRRMEAGIRPVFGQSLLITATPSGLPRPG